MKRSPAPRTSVWLHKRVYHARPCGGRLYAQSSGGLRDDPRGYLRSGSNAELACAQFGDLALARAEDVRTLPRAVCCITSPGREAARVRCQERHSPRPREAADPRRRLFVAFIGWLVTRRDSSTVRITGEALRARLDHPGVRTCELGLIR